MPQAVTHVLTSIILVDLYRDYITKYKKLFPLHTIFLAGFFGLLPDIDIPIRMISQFFNFNVPWLLQHGGVTHTPFFALLFLIPGIIFWKKNKHKTAVIFFVATFAIMLHILLDFLLGGGGHNGIMVFFPFLTQGFKIHLLNYFKLEDLPAAIDAVILLAWIWHEDRKHKILDYI